MKPACPECGGKVFYSYTCHTYKQGERWVSCLPCDSAVDYDCYAEDCGWGYTHGLNSGNPRAARNEERKPSWLEGKPTFVKGRPGYGSYTWTHPDVSATWDRDDDD